MRIIFDTNVLFSALLHPGPQMQRLLELAISEHEVFTPKYVADELFAKVIEVSPDSAGLVDEFLRTLGPIIPEGTSSKGRHPSIRDPNDLPILVAAINLNVDILITGDKDFLAVEIDRPRIMKPRWFLDEFSQE